MVLFRPLLPFHWPQNTWPWMTLNDHFTLNSAFFTGMSRALKPGFRNLPTLKLVLNIGEHQTETNGIARFPCDSTAFLLCLPKASLWLVLCCFLASSLVCFDFSCQWQWNGLLRVELDIKLYSLATRQSKLLRSLWKTHNLNQAHWGLKRWYLNCADTSVICLPHGGASIRKEHWDSRSAVANLR